MWFRISQAVKFCSENPLVMLECFIIVLLIIVCVSILHKKMITDFMGISCVVIFSGWLCTRMNNLAKLYNDYVERVSIINSSDNLSLYKNKESQYMRPIKKFRVFKKSNFRVNLYYWKVKTKDYSYYYTTTDDENSTLHNILRTTKISEFRGKCVNDFFEYCLISYITNEDEELMENLSKGNEVTLENNASISTQEHFERRIEGNETTELDNSSCSKKTPDLYIDCEGQSCVIDAYNGTSKEEIMKKIRSYSSCFPQSRVYVFSSGVSALEQLTTSKGTFSFYCMDDMNDKTPKKVPKIECGPVILDISEICDRYFSEYRIFKSEIFYWLNCEQEGSIMQTQLDSK